MSPGAVDVPDRVRLAIQDLIKKHGTLATAKMLGVSRDAVTRLAAGSPVRAGTLLMAQTKLAGVK